MGEPRGRSLRVVFATQAGDGEFWYFLIILGILISCSSAIAAIGWKEWEGGITKVTSSSAFKLDYPCLDKKTPAFIVQFQDHFRAISSRFWLLEFEALTASFKHGRISADLKERRGAIP